MAKSPEKQRSDEAGLDCSKDRPLTQQQYRDECDINIIMKQYTQDGLLPPGTQATALYGDFSDVNDFLDAQLIVKEAQEQFAMLSARVRDRFHNDPVEFLDFVHNKDNLPEAKDLGLLQAEPEPPPNPPPAKPVEGQK